jgi:hypothetical protein
LRYLSPQPRTGRGKGHGTGWYRREEGLVVIE